MLTTSSHVTHFCKAYLSLTIFQRVFIGHLNVKALHPVWWSVHSLEPHQIFAPIVHKKVKHRDMPNIPEVKPSAASLEVLACRVQALLPWGLAPILPRPYNTQLPGKCLQSSGVSLSLKRL